MLLAPEVTLADGRYRLLEARAIGGMATVWLAHDERLDRPVAVKVMSDSLAVDPGFVHRFQREAQVAARLSHPNLVRLFDFGTEDGRPFLVSEWIDGPDLQELRGDGGQVDGEALAIDLLAALDHIHRAGIVHRDVKPSNVVLDEDGRARLTDFGIAQPEDATRLTQTGMVMGTVPFIAPEVLRGEPSTRQSDLYSVGRLLDYMLGDDAPPQLASLIARLSAEEPSERPRSATDAFVRRGEPRADTRRVIEYEATPEPAPPSGPPTEPLIASSPPAPSPAPSRWAIVPVVLAMLGIAVALLLVGDSDDEPSRAPAGAAKADTEPGSELPEGDSSTESGGETGTEPVAPESTSPIPEPRNNTDSTRGAELNDEGFDLIGAGAYEKAVKVLEKAVSYFPPATEDLGYAYALYNLGHALRLSGRPEEAIPVLEARLEIPNQTETVQQELDLARAEAGEG